MEQLRINGSEENFGKYHHPVVKLFLPAAGGTWLLTETDPEYPNMAFGLCDLGMGFPELGYVNLEELLEVRALGVFGIERDLFFEAKYPISVYARAAWKHQAIIDDPNVLKLFIK
jgi:hypothetical protein